MATHLLYEEGLGVGVDTIVARSGVAKATLYTHFPSKERLVCEVLERRDHDWCLQMAAAVERSGGEAGARLLAVFDLLEEEFASKGYRGSPFLNAMAELPDREHAARRACEEHARKVAARLEELAAEAGARDAPELAQELMLLMHGAVSARVLHGDFRAALRARRAARVLLEEATR